MTTASRIRTIPLTRSDAACICMGLFFFYALESLNWAPRHDPFYDFFFLGSISIAFVVGIFAHDLRWVWIGALALIAANVAFFEFCYVTEYLWRLRYGIFGGPNYFATALALGVAGALAYRLWWYLPFAFFGLLGTQSRTAIIAVIITVAIWGGRKLWLVIGLVAFLGVAVIVQKPAIDRSTESRIGIWQDTINHMRPFGNGWGSFRILYPTFPVKTNTFGENARHAYNDAIEVIFDLGVGAIPLFLLLIIAAESFAADRLILWTFCLLSLSFFPFYELGVAHMFFMTLGRLSRTYGAKHA